MAITCKNCDTQFEGKFCCNCGQAASTKRLDIKSVWHDIQHGLLHIDKGVFYTLIQLFTRPGHSIREYLEGKRIKHFKPLSLVIILATIYALLNHYLHIDLVEDNKNTISFKIFGLGVDFQITQGQNKPLVAEIKDYIETHFALFQLLFLPFFAGASMLAFRKKGYNYIEHLVINAFLRGQALIFGMLLLPFVYFGIISSELNYNILLLLQISSIIWAFIQLFNADTKAWVVKRSLLVVLYLMLEIIVAISISALVMYVIGLVL